MLKDSAYLQLLHVPCREPGFIGYCIEREARLTPPIRLLCVLCAPPSRPGWALGEVWTDLSNNMCCVHFHETLQCFVAVSGLYSSLRDSPSVAPSYRENHELQHLLVCFLVIQPRSSTRSAEQRRLAPEHHAESAVTGTALHCG